MKNRTILNCNSNDIAYLIRISLLSLLFSLSRCGIPISILILITNPKIKGQLMAKYVPFLAPIRLLVGLHRGIESNIPRNKKLKGLILVNKCTYRNSRKETRFSF